jgi:glycosyltransferase involved in cell wall biosynthesis
MEKISVALAVYNEEKRIERFLKSFNSFDEIIVFDKSSTDNTVSLCLNSGAKVISIPYTNRGDIGKEVTQIARNNWLLFVTASDIIHPKLSNLLIDLINKKEFNKDIVFLPYMIYTHGINSIHSVFDSNYRPCLVKKDVIFFHDRVHEEVSFNSGKKYYLPKNRKIAIHHLTHENMDSSFERIIRYTREELKKEQTLMTCLKTIFKIIIQGIKRRFWILGWDGIAMLLLLLNYHITVFLRTWEKKRNIDVEFYYNELARNL